MITIFLVFCVLVQLVGLAVWHLIMTYGWLTGIGSFAVLTLSLFWLEMEWFR